jgi:hypothetical protein
MTEAEWLSCNDPRFLLVFLEGKVCDRKARLFACAIGRSLWPYLGDDRSRHIIEIAEKQADGAATLVELATTREAALDAVRGAASRIASQVGDQFPWQAARMVVVSVQQAQAEYTAKEWSGPLLRRSRKVLHCVFGNPFRPVIVDPGWLDWNGRIIPKLADAIYDERRFDDLPILADALEDAGCDNADILDHCRQPGEHARGCWVIDLLLGKK